MAKTNLFQRITGLMLPPVKPKTEQGTSGTPVVGGYVQTIERSANWTGRQKYITMSEMVSNISIIAASVRYFLNLVSYPEWSVKPSDENSPAAREMADFVHDVMHDMVTPWPRVVKKAASYQFYGFTTMEWIAKLRDDGQIGFKDVENRPQHTIDRWEVDEKGSILGCYQRSPTTGEYFGLPIGKLVYLVDDTMSDSPEGLGIFRQLADPYNRLRQFLKLEAIAFERDLRGIPIGRAPLQWIREAVAAGKITDDEGNELINGMDEFIQLAVKQTNTGLVLDSTPYFSQAADGAKVSAVPHWDVQLLQGSANGLAELNVSIDRIQREIARVVGTEHIMMGDKGGNRALSEDKSRNLYLAANSVLFNMTTTFQSDWLKPLWLLNGFDDELMPSLQTEDVSFKDAAEIAATLRDMAAAGAMLSPNDPAIGDLRDLLGVSRPDPDDLLLDATLPRNAPEDDDDAAEEIEDDSTGEDEI